MLGAVFVITCPGYQKTAHSCAVDRTDHIFEHISAFVTMTISLPSQHTRLKTLVQK